MSGWGVDREILGGAEHRARALEKYGWKPYEGRAYLCPRVIAGKRCVRHNSNLGRVCTCRFRGTPLDHMRRWVGPNGEKIITGEPYDFDAEDDHYRFSELVAECDELGISVDVRSPEDSVYYPDSTWLIVLTATPA